MLYEYAVGRQNGMPAITCVLHLNRANRHPGAINSGQHNEYFLGSPHLLGHHHRRAGLRRSGQMNYVSKLRTLGLGDGLVPCLLTHIWYEGSSSFQCTAVGRTRRNYGLFHYSCLPRAQFYDSQKTKIF